MTVSRTGRLTKAALFVVALALPAALPVPAASAANSQDRKSGANSSNHQRKWGDPLPATERRHRAARMAGRAVVTVAVVLGAAAPAH